MKIFDDIIIFEDDDYYDFVCFAAFNILMRDAFKVYVDDCHDVNTRIVLMFC